jgi:type I restriction-modification system DNA methylase subunit
MLKSGKELIKDLVEKYQNLTPKQKNNFNESNTVLSFIRPLFEALDWDFSNINEVESEKSIVKGRVDFVFKLNNVTKFCVEVKSLHHDLTDDDREQAISYAYNKGVTWAILTNFDRLQVFNAEVKTHDLNSILFPNLQFQDYISDFQDLFLLSKDSAINDELDKKAEKYGKLARRIPVEQKLYEQLKNWREQLFNEVYHFNKDSGVTFDQTDQLIQKLFSRLIFIRTAEDRNLAGNHPLLSALHQFDTEKKGLLDKVKIIFKDFAQIFDSDIFPKKNDLWEKIWINDHLLADIINGLYQVPGDYAKYYFNVIEPDVLGQVYEQYLGYVAKAVKPKPKIQQSLFPVTEQQIEISSKIEKRKKSGIYYTPKWVTDYIVRQTINRFINEHNHHEILNMKILDPACGSGSFLIRAYDELLSYHAKIKKKSVADLNWSERIEILTRNIFGVDLDPQAVEIARLNLLIRALAERDLLPSLEDNIQCGNSLIFGEDEELEKLFGPNFKDYKPFNWNDKFADVMKSGGFDVVIGNPPYVMELRDNKDTFRILSATQLGEKYYEPKMDIFYFFIEHGIDLLKSDGYLGFIVQQYWVSRTHATKLRKKIFDDTSPITLVDFSEYQIFRDAPGQHNMITILKKPKDKDAKTLIMHLEDSSVTEQAITKALAISVEDQKLFEARTVETSQLYDLQTDKVYIVRSSVSHLLNKLTTNSFNLDETEIQQGIVTPQHYLMAKAIVKMRKYKPHQPGEGIFVLTKKEKQDLQLNYQEKKLIRPFHYAEEIDSYHFNPNIGYYLIYTPVEVAKDIEDNPAKYPNIIAHLDEYQEVITSDHAPYGIHRARQPEWFEDPKKIICVRKTMYPKCALVPDVWYGDQAVHIIRLTAHKKISPRLVLAILNSQVSHFWLYQQKRQGNQLQVDKEVLLHLPFPNAILSPAKDNEICTKILALVNKLESKKTQLQSVKDSEKDLFGEQQKELQSDIVKTKLKIDQLVFTLYGLTEKEIRQIQSMTSIE